MMVLDLERFRAFAHACVGAVLGADEIISEKGLFL
jgi:hypothetical protein